jgi:cathepsin L
MAGWSQEDMSEQHILDCSDAGDCGGGRRWDAVSWATGTQVASENGYPMANPGYKGIKQQCDLSVIGSRKLLASGWIDSSGNVPSPDVLKKALCQYGPISVSMYASTAFQNYGGSSSEVFDENNNNNGTNHAILLIGWDDSKQAWLMKNSWGSRWGFDGGYGWVKYGSNNIGKSPVWATAPIKDFALPKSVQDEVDKLVYVGSSNRNF